MAKANWQCPSEWSEWSNWLAAGLHARNRWRLPVLLTVIDTANEPRSAAAKRMMRFKRARSAGEILVQVAKNWFRLISVHHDPVAA